MTHKYAIGQNVYFAAGFPRTGADGTYRIVSLLPVEKDERLRYRIKSVSENFERVADELQLSIDD